MVLAVIIILIIIIIALIVYNLLIHKRLQASNNMGEQVRNLNIVQEFMNIVGEEISADEKIQKINETLIRKYNIKYSTIVVLDGAEYIIKASNVDQKHWESLKNLHKEEIFKESVTSAIPKYVTTERDNEILPYQKQEFGRAKSAMFFPLYIDNIYIGYWIIESGEKHAFDTLDTTILEVVKQNIISVLKTINYQNTLESIVRIDQFTGLNSAEYIYGIGKRTIDKYTTSTVCMFRITNLEEINEKFGRNIGNETVIKVSNIIKANISSEYIFVRYMGPKFVIIFSGVETDSVSKFLNDIKQYVEETKIVDNEKNKKSKNKIQVTPKLNFAISTYYKETGIEKLTKKLEEYLDNAPKDESALNYI